MIVAPLFIMLFAISVETHKIGGVEDMAETKAAVVRMIENRKPVDYSKMNG